MALALGYGALLGLENVGIGTWLRSPPWFGKCWHWHLATEPSLVWKMLALALGYAATNIVYVSVVVVVGGKSYPVTIVD